MSSIRSSRLVAWGLVAMLALSVAAPVAAVSVASEDVASEAEVGSDYSATMELGDLYSENDKWVLNASTELTNQPLWTLELVDDGDVTKTVTKTGQNVTFSDTEISSPVDKVRVTVEGQVPEVGNWSYANRPSFEAVALSQVPVTSDGLLGAPSTIDSWSTAHYTADSKEARDAIGSATSSIEDAESQGADVAAAESSLKDAKRFYGNADFDAAVTNAEEAKTQANEAASQKESAQQTQQLLVYAGVGIVLVLLLGGGFYWYTQNQQDTSRLG